MLNSKEHFILGQSPHLEGTSAMFPSNPHI